jgi:hypothetical protein
MLGEESMNFFQQMAMNIVMGAVSGKLQDIPEKRLMAWLHRVGLAFGPANLRHFSVLPPEEQAALLVRVPVLKTNHSDWPKPVSWVPRRWTAWIGPAPTLADVIVGQVTEMKPIPKKGEWYVLRGYMASTTAEGIYNRLGWRYDDVDDYFEFPAFTIKTF